MKRVASIDIVRGVVIIIMALDHVRDLIHTASITQSATDLTTTSPILFFTRWVTHLCAPIFVFLAGTSAFISFDSKNNILQTKRHLLKRGVWLILIEFTVVNFAIFFDVGFNTLLFEVIASIGMGFIILSLLLKLSPKQLGIIGLIIICCHNLVPFIPFAENSILKKVLLPLFSPTAMPLFSEKVFVMGYPPIPWLGIMLIGFACGNYFKMAAVERNSIFMKIGWGAIALFIALRLLNVYGDPSQWTAQKNALFTFLSFMNVTKYPPSLMFCLITLGIMFLLLSVTDNFPERVRKIASVYGKVPLFYFVVHFYLIHLITLTVLFMQGFNWSQFEFATGTFGRPKGIESGLLLWQVYLLWIFVVALLYKPCLWFGQFKQKNKFWWLRYI